MYIDGSQALKRDAGEGVAYAAYANFAVHNFRYLNLAPLVSASVKEPRECGKLCVDHSSSFSTNLAAYVHTYTLYLVSYTYCTSTIQSFSPNKHIVIRTICPPPPPVTDIWSFLRAKVLGRKHSKRLSKPDLKATFSAVCLVKTELRSNDSGILFWKSHMSFTCVS